MGHSELAYMISVFYIIKFARQIIEKGVACHDARTIS